MLFQMLPLLVGMVLIMYFTSIRPQQKREKERQALLNSLKKGDEVVTAGGLCGTIVGLSDTHAVVKVDDNCKIEFLRSAITQVVKRDS